MFSNTISRYAQAFEKHHQLPSDESQTPLESTPSPTGPRFGPVLYRSFPRDKERLRLGVTDAARYMRVFGSVAALRMGSHSSGKVAPDSSQSATKVCWWKPSRSRCGRGYYRTSAYSADCVPNRATRERLMFACGFLSLVLWRDRIPHAPLRI